MGYTLTIGEAVIDEPNTYDHDVRISVTAHRSDDAPHIATSTPWPNV